MEVKAVATKAFEGQKPGTSGLRKKARVFEQEHYVENFVQATLAAVDGLAGEALVVGGDGRYYNKVMIQKIVRLCAAHGLGKVVIGKDGLLSTPAVSCLIRELGAAGGFILTASHNPGGPDEDCGIKYNVSNGGPAPENITNAIYKNTTEIKQYKIATGVPDIDLSKIGTTKIGDMTIEIVDPTDEYCKLLDSVFDFEAIKKLLDRKDFTFVYDAMHGIAGPYAKRIFHDELGVPQKNLFNCVPSETFNGGHPDPNLTYASELVARMGLTSTGAKTVTGADIPDLGAAADGDADRNMILGKQFFVTPSDSLAVLAANANCIPFFAKAGGLKTVARSMPTSAAVDLVAKEQGLNLFEVPTGWKFFGNLMDSKSLGKKDMNPVLCGEESFGTGSNHIREKDGIWAVLAWLSILASNNPDPSKPLVSVQDIVERHWKKYGRNYYARYDYEGVDSANADKVFARLTSWIEKSNGKSVPDASDSKLMITSDEFEYKDPVDGSVSAHQGWRFHLSDGSRFVVRRSGTGSSGATIRIYLEKHENNDISQETAVALKPLAEKAMEYTNIVEFTGMKAPTVIT